MFCLIKAKILSLGTQHDKGYKINSNKILGSESFQVFVCNKSILTKVESVNHLNPLMKRH